MKPLLRGAAACLVAALGSLPVLAQTTIDKPAATVRLEKQEVVTVKQLKQQVQALETRSRSTLSADERRKLLDLMVSEILINQAAAKDNIAVSEAEVNTRITLAKQSGGLSLNLNRELTDEEFRSVLEKSGLSWQEYADQLRKALIQQKYVMKQKRSLLENISPPSESDIIEFYESNKTLFVSPDMVRFKHIFIDTRQLSSQPEKDQAKTKIEKIARELQSGTPFEDLVIKYSEDKTSRYTGGDFGYLRRDDAARKQLLGKDFFEAPFRMKDGEVSQTLRSNIGYHLIKVVERIPFKLLALDDKIPPQNAGTVRDEIRAQLLQRKQAEYFQRALNEVLDELKKKAEIKIFDQNLIW